MAVFKVTSECYVEDPTAEQAIAAQIDQLTLRHDGGGFYNPNYAAWFGAGAHCVIACDNEGNRMDGAAGSEQ